MGMRAGSGAIDRVEWRDGALHCGVIGGTAPRGICGSGLVDAAAALAEGGLVLPTGRMRNGAKEITLAEGVGLAQSDIRELQLAKGAIAAGALLLREKLGAEKPATFHLAGAFGNYVRAGSAKRIGLLPDDSAVVPEGNAALRGTRLLLLRPSTARCAHGQHARQDRARRTRRRGGISGCLRRVYEACSTRLGRPRSDISTVTGVTAPKPHQVQS